MKAGYVIDSFVSKKHTCIEVVNFTEQNGVLNFGWKKYESYLNNKDKNTVGVWKVKK